MRCKVTFFFLFNLILIVHAPCQYVSDWQTNRTIKTVRSFRELIARVDSEDRLVIAAQAEHQDEINDDILLLKHDLDGDTLWCFDWSDSADIDHNLIDMHVNGSGTIFIGARDGHTSGIRSEIKAVSPEGSIVWEKSLLGVYMQSFKKTYSGNLLYSGDGKVGLLDSNGVTLWQVEYPSNATNIDLITEAEPGIYFHGHGAFTSTFPIWITKMDSTGNILWEQDITEYTNRIQKLGTKDGKVYVVYETFGSIAIMRISSEGAIEKSKTLEKDAQLGLHAERDIYLSINDDHGVTLGAPLLKDGVEHFGVIRIDSSFTQVERIDVPNPCAYNFEALDFAAEEGGGFSLVGRSGCDQGGSMILKFNAEIALTWQSSEIIETNEGGKYEQINMTNEGAFYITGTKGIGLGSVQQELLVQKWSPCAEAQTSVIYGPIDACAQQSPHLYYVEGQPSSTYEWIVQGDIDFVLDGNNGDSIYVNWDGLQPWPYVYVIGLPSPQINIGRGLLTVFGTSSSNCRQSNDYFEVEIEQCLMTEELHSEKIQVFPNPTIDQAQIQTQDAIKQVRVYDLSGALKLVSYKDIIDLSEVPAGVYIVETETGIAIHRTRMVKL